MAMVGKQDHRQQMLALDQLENTDEILLNLYADRNKIVTEAKIQATMFSMSSTLFSLLRRFSRRRGDRYQISHTSLDCLRITGKCHCQKELLFERHYLNILIDNCFD